MRTTRSRSTSPSRGTSTIRSSPSGRPSRHDWRPAWGGYSGSGSAGSPAGGEGVRGGSVQSADKWQFGLPEFVGHVVQVLGEPPVLLSLELYPVYVGEPLALGTPDDPA